MLTLPALLGACVRRVGIAALGILTDIWDD